MLHTHRLPIIFAIVCIGLSACAAPQNPPLPAGEGGGEGDAPTATALPPTVTASHLPTEPFTPTPEPTATEAPYNVDVETARQKAIIENAPNNIQEFSYLQSDEYFQSLKDRNAKGEFPKISPNASFVEVGDVNLRFEDLENNPSNVFEKYGVDNAYTFERSWRWRLPENRPWVVVDAGVTEIGQSKTYFYVLKWKNFDGSEAFWGRIFTPLDGESVVSVLPQTIDRNGNGYPSIGYYKSVDLCIKSNDKYTAENVVDFCALLGDNPDSAIPKDAIKEWRATGILKLNFLPWSQSTPHLQK